MAYRYPATVRFLALAAALPWSALLLDGRAAAGAPAGTTSAVVSASDTASVLTAVLAERKPVAKGERLGLDGSALPVAVRAPIVAARVASSGGGDALRIGRANHPSCAILCRFLL